MIAFKLAVGCTILTASVQKLGGTDAKESRSVEGIEKTKTMKLCHQFFNVCIVFPCLCHYVQYHLYRYTVYVYHICSGVIDKSDWSWCPGCDLWCRPRLQGAARSSKQAMLEVQKRQKMELPLGWRFWWVSRVIGWSVDGVMMFGDHVNCSLKIMLGLDEHS